jgi:hypothetical protein
MHRQPGIGLGVTRNHLVFVALAICCVTSPNVANGQASTTTSTNTAMLQGACPAIADCVNDAVCSECLSLLLPIIAKDESTRLRGVVKRSAQTDFFFGIVGQTCFRNDTVVPLLGAAADDIFNLPCNSMGHNWPRLPVNDPCLSVEFNCILNPDCRQCLHGIYTSENKSDALNSPPCVTIGIDGLQNLSQCYTFPQCTFAKQQCADDVTHSCPTCLGMLRDGDFIGAMQQCSTSVAGSSATLLDNVAFDCMENTDSTCNYFIARCDQDAACGSCLADVGGAQTAHDVAEAFLISSSCMSTLGSSSSSTQANQLLWNVVMQCPVTSINVCQELTVMCILHGGEECATCLAGSVAQQNDPSCEPLLNAYDVLNACQPPCSNSVYENNRIVMATSIAGGVSILPCIVVILVVVAYGKDLMYIRSRIIMGLMISNIVYSIGNAIPVAMLQTSVDTCGQTSLSFNTIRFGRAWWFAGKYALIFFELFILGVAAWALQYGPPQRLAVHREATLHFTCTMAGIFAFVGFFVKSGEIESEGYNAVTQAEIQSDAFSYLGANDDLDDDLPDGPAKQRFADARNEYDTLVQQMLQVWIAFLGMSIVLWSYLRWTFARFTKSWLVTLSEAEKQWDRDLWDQQSTRQTKRRFLELTKESYDELFRPLEPFVAVFVAFGVPACIMATDYCHEHSQISAPADASGLVASITVGKCDVVCELILSFRSIATVAVFFYSREHRNEIYNFRTMWRRLRARVKGWVQSSDSRHSVRFRGFLLEEVQMIPMLDGDGDAGDVDGTAGATVPYKLMDDEDTEGASSRDTEL